MNWHQALSVLTLQAILILLWGDTASARVWEIEFEQNKFITVPLQTQDANNTVTICPDGFRPVRLEHELDLGSFGRLTVTTRTSEHFLATAQDLDKANRLISLTVSLDVTGCTYGHHLVVENGYATVFGDLGIGLIRPTTAKVEMRPSHYLFASNYAAHLAGPVRERFFSRNFFNPRVKKLPEPENEKVLGKLSVRLSDVWFNVLSNKRRQDDALLDFLVLRVIVLEE